VSWSSFGASIIIWGVIGVASVHCVRAVAGPPLLEGWLGVAVHHLQTVSVVLFFFIFRLGTFRRLVSSPTVYHHNETDERIFQELVAAVSRNLSDYSLHNKDIMHQLRLSVENYGDRVFIHPPFFVYMSVLMQWLSNGALQLPGIPLIFNAITLCSIPLLLKYSGLDCKENLGVNGLWAMVIFCCCPFTCFVSQKFWIDNALLMTCSLACTFHVYLVSSHTPSVISSFTSGFLFFGLLALNTKLTALALLPFLMLWLVLHKVRDENGQFAASDRLLGKLANALLHCVAFIVGSVLAYAPWACIYYGHTQRLFPNAWPSTDMIKKSTFLQTAVRQPYYFYLRSVLVLNPLYLPGLLTGIGCGVCVLIRAVRFSHTEMNDEFYRQCKLAVFALWPLSFITAFSALGILGAGFQTRFILPMVPCCCCLTAVSISKLTARVGSTAVIVPSVLLAYASIHSFYYGVLFAPLFADLDFNVWDIIWDLLDALYYPPRDQNTFKECVQWVRHYGVNREPR
jgi:hypothetical protein